MNQNLKLEGVIMEGEKKEASKYEECFFSLEFASNQLIRAQELLKSDDFSPGWVRGYLFYAAKEVNAAIKTLKEIRGLEEQRTKDTFITKVVGGAKRFFDFFWH
jgi:hypothetical protein